MNAPITAGALPGPSRAVVFQAVSDGAVLLHMEDEVYYGLNAVGVRIWQLLPESRDLGDLCSRLGKEYPDAEPEQLREDTRELLDALGRAGLVVSRS